MGLVDVWVGTVAVGFTGIGGTRRNPGLGDAQEELLETPGKVRGDGETHGVSVGLTRGPVSPRAGLPQGAGRGRREPRGARQPAEERSSLHPRGN